MKPWAGPVVQRARSSVMVLAEEEKGELDAGLLDPRVAAVAVKVGMVRSVPGGEEMGPRQG